MVQIFDERKVILEAVFQLNIYNSFWAINFHEMNLYV